jgi:hypothetical protein
LKSLDDLPTLAELRDLDDIKVQLEFPGGAAANVAMALPAASADTPATEASSAEVQASEAHVAESDESLDEDVAADDEDDADRETPGAPTLAASPPGLTER